MAVGMVDDSKGVGVPEVMSVKVLAGWLVMGVVTDAMVGEEISWKGGCRVGELRMAARLETQSGISDD